MLEGRGKATLIGHIRWNSPDDLAVAYSSDLLNSSRGRLNHTLAVRVEAEAYPVKADGFLYDDASFLACLSDAPEACHMPDTSDYRKILRDFSVCEYLNNGTIDELWMFGAPYMGFWEAN